MSYIFSYFRRRLFSEQIDTLSQWQEKSFIFVFISICLAALPALIDSSIRAVRDGNWFTLAAYIGSYLLCVLITLTKFIPFNVRAWIGILVFLGLGGLSIFTSGPFGSGRIWLFTTSVFATLILGINSGVLILLAQLIILSCFAYLLKIDFNAWVNLNSYSQDIWATTSITFMFLSIVSVVAMGRLIRGLSQALDKSQETSEQLRETTRQLTERVQAHDKTIVSLKESQELWLFALEGAGDGVWDWNVKSAQVYFSPRWKKMLGYEENDLGTDVSEWFDRIHPEDQTWIIQELEQNIKDNIPHFQNRYRLRCKDHSYKWILDRGKVMAWDNEGNALRIIGTHADITLIKNMEKQHIEYEAKLQQAQKMEALGTLAGGIAHDFNNILFPIMGYTEMLLEDLPENSPFQSSLEQIYSASMRARNLVRQILTFSRQEQSELELIRVQEIINEALKLIRSTIPATIEIKQDIRADCGLVKADPTQIHQIVMNLTTNAYHAMEKTGGELKVILKELQLGAQDVLSLDLEPGIYACLTVSDTGMGMRKDMKKKIFDPFFTTKERGKGTGMGLSVVHGVVKNVKGAVQVDSEPGKGTDFHVYFPVENISSKEKEQIIQPQIASRGGTEEILLVDDDETLLTMEKKMLERLGYQVTSHINSVNALEAFKVNPGKFDLVITDVAMPNMPGDKLAIALNKIRPDIPILLCTGFSEIMSEEKALSMGINGFLMKPIVMGDLSKKIRDLLYEADPLTQQ